MVYKPVNNLASDILIGPFEKRSEGTARTLRSTNAKFKASLLRATAGQDSFLYCGGKLWNDLIGKQNFLLPLTLLRNLFV